MQKQITSYLFQNKSCPLPGLGTLSVLSSGAEADFTNKLIAAPKSFISFVDAESDTAGLVQYLAATSSGSDDKISESLNQYCDNLKKQITDQSNVKLEQIGQFFIDGSGKINFKQEELPRVFSQNVFAERVIHPEAEHHILVGDKETTNTVMTERLSAKPETRDRWWIWAIVIGAVGLALLLIYFTQFSGTSSFGNVIKI